MAETNGFNQPNSELFSLLSNVEKISLPGKLVNLNTISQVGIFDDTCLPRSQIVLTGWVVTLIDKRTSLLKYI